MNKKEKMYKWIRVSSEVHNHLVEHGRKNESFDKILRRLLRLNRDRQGEMKWNQ